MAFYLLVGCNVVRVINLIWTLALFVSKHTNVVAKRSEGYLYKRIWDLFKIENKGLTGMIEERK